MGKRMRIIVIDLHNESNLEIWRNKYDSKKRKYTKEWEDLVHDPKNIKDAVKFFKEFGREPNAELIELDQPRTIEEWLVYRAYFDKGYESYRQHFPEDICEERLSWDRLREMADSMAYLINHLTDIIDPDVCE